MKVAEPQILHARAQEALVVRGIGDLERPALADHEPRKTLPFLEMRDLVERLGERAPEARERHAGVVLVAQEDLGDLGSGRRQGSVEDVLDRPGANVLVRSVCLMLALYTREARPQDDHGPQRPADAPPAHEPAVAPLATRRFRLLCAAVLGGNSLPQRALGRALSARMRQRGLARRARPSLPQLAYAGRSQGRLTAMGSAPVERSRCTGRSVSTR